VHAVPLLPEQVLVTLPAGTLVLVMTHDHAEDHAIVDAALRMTEPRLGMIGLIGSSAKWTRMRQRLLADGLAESDVERVVTPIGLPGVGGKDPAVIAVSIAADLLQRIHAVVGQAPAARHVED
jgi:xanthine dehydrogenase accessory factor